MMLTRGLSLCAGGGAAVLVLVLVFVLPQAADLMAKLGNEALARAKKKFVASEARNFAQGPEGAEVS